MEKSRCIYCNFRICLRISFSWTAPGPHHSGRPRTRKVGRFFSALFRSMENTGWMAPIPLRPKWSTWFVHYRKGLAIMWVLTPGLNFLSENPFCSKFFFCVRSADGEHLYIELIWLFFYFFISYSLSWIRYPCFPSPECWTISQLKGRPFFCLWFQMLLLLKFSSWPCSIHQILYNFFNFWNILTSFKTCLFIILFSTTYYLQWYEIIFLPVSQADKIYIILSF
jgi:hypothetical protein